MNDKKKLIIAFVSVLVVMTFVFRVLKLVPNFMPVGALALWCGLYLKSRWSFVIPLLLMVVTDLIVGWHSLVFFTWGCVILYQLIGYGIRNRKNAGTVVAASLSGSLLFYVVTNFAVWAFTPMYTKTWAGLVQCYYMAIPFFRNTMISDLVYVAAFIALYQAAYYFVVSRQSHPAAQKATQ